MKRQFIPLEDYWNKLAFGDNGRPLVSVSPPPDVSINHPDFLAWEQAREKEWGCVGDAEQKAWREICDRASQGKIRILAFRHVVAAGWRSDYPDFPADNVREIIPAEFFAQLGIYIGPTPPVVIYYLSTKMGGPMNAPWSEPVVEVSWPDAERPSQSKIVEWFLAYISKFPRAKREDIRAAATAAFGYPFTHDDVRELRTAHLPETHPSKKKGRPVRA